MWLSWIIWAQLALAAVLLAMFWQPRNHYLAIGSSLTAVALAIPIGGRSALGWLGIATAFALRRRSGRMVVDIAGRTTDLTTPASHLATLIPGLSLVTTDTHDDVPVGLVGLRGSWTVVLAVRPDQQIVARVGEADTLPIDSLLPLLDVAGIALDSIQVVVHNSPGSSALPENSAGRISHLELLGGLPTAARRRVLIALRLDPGSCPQAIAARGGGVLGAHRALAATAARAIAALAEAGFQMQTMNATETVNAIAAVAGLHQPDLTDEARWTERWSQVSIGPLIHRSFLVSGWGTSPSTGNPLDQLGNIRALAVSTSVTLTGTPQHTLVTGTVRITTSNEPADLNTAEQHLRRTAERIGIELTNAHGCQHDALLAGLPLGGPRPEP